MSTTPQTERALVEQRMRDSAAQIITQRALIASLQAKGRNTASAVNVLSALEGGRAIRVRRLATLS